MKEKTVIENENANVNVEVNATEEKKITVLVERETFTTKKKKELMGYFIRATIRGKDVKINLAAVDVGGYTVLDIVFGEANQLPLTLVPYQLNNEETGELIQGYSYKIVSYDEDGTSYECKVKPAAQSDRDLMKMLLR